MWLRRTVFLVAMLMLAALACAQSGPALDALLHRKLAGQLVIQKHFACGEKVSYSGVGETSAPLGSWTTCGYLLVQAVKLTDDHTIEIEAQRVLLVYDPARRDFASIKTGKKPSPVVIRIQAPVTYDEASVQAAVTAVFVPTSEHLSEFVPEYWKPVLVQREIDNGERPKAEAIPFPTTPKVAGGVKPPRAVATPDPDYDPVAKKLSFQGTCVLRLVVDESGRPRDIRIATPLGFGLDEKAAEAVSRWKFNPARRDGMPLPVQLSVEVNFRLY